MNTVGGRLSTCDSKVLLWSHRREIHLLPHDPLPRDHSATALLRADRVRICRNFRVTLELPCHGSGRGAHVSSAGVPLSLLGSQRPLTFLTQAGHGVPPSYSD